ncbi:MAG: hypothetical protein II304_10060 [Bacteroidales bacterium]|nr:hypothetical protein [Bacteroidales bacterium]
MMIRRNIKARAVVKTAKKPIEDNFAQYMNEPVESEEVTYTKTEINRMSTADLKALAKSKDVEDAEKMSGAELKKELVKFFNL